VEKKVAMEKKQAAMDEAAKALQSSKEEIKQQKIHGTINLPNASFGNCVLRLSTCERVTN
jgi:hypothetical protein